MEPNAIYLTAIDAALRGAALALLVLSITSLWRARAVSPLARAGLLLALGLCVQVISSAPLFEHAVPRYWQAPFIAISVGNGVLFWLFVQAMFDDDFTLRRAHATIWLAVAGVSAFNCALPADTNSVLATFTLGLQRAVPLVFAVLAVYSAVVNWRSDLVEDRRRLRSFILVTGVVYTVVMVAVRIGSPHGRLSALSGLVDVATLLVIVAVAARYLFQVTASDVLPRADSSEPQHESPAGPASADRAPLAPDPVEDRLAEGLQRLIEAEKVYRTENLSIAGLSARLGVPDYRLRRLINQRLGHRNFNAFLNSFRLEEARAALADPRQRETPVLTIALSAGFQSIGPFNRAFKVATGLTPTEFRREKLAES